MSTALDRYIEWKTTSALGDRRALWRRLIALERENSFLKHAEEMAAKRILLLTRQLQKGLNRRKK